jgi:FHS family L-fucose permease-like MFS transporter
VERASQRALRSRARKAGISAAFLSVTTLFFAWGFITSNNDPLLVTLRAIFHLSYTEALLTQLVFFLAFGLMSLPAASLGNRIGPVDTIVVALAIMIAGCLLVRFSLGFGVYPLILCALFVLAIGITTLQVSANPLAASLGSAKGSHFRLNLAQAFNSLGVVLGVNYGAWVMLGDTAIVTNHGLITDAIQRRDALDAIDRAFTHMAVLLAVLGVFILVQRRRITNALTQIVPEPTARVFDALKSGWAVSGAVAIGLYVGAEVSIGSIMINFLHQPSVLGLPFEEGGRYLADFYWGGALAGRIVGSILLTRIAAPRLLKACAVMAASLCTLVLIGDGAIAGYAALSVGLFNSIMFPTIFTISLERSAATQSSTSGLLCLAIVGGAVLPVMVGLLADTVSLTAAFAIIALAYSVIVIFASKAASTPPIADADAPPVPPT